MAAAPKTLRCDFHFNSPSQCWRSTTGHGLTRLAHFLTRTGLYGAPTAALIVLVIGAVCAGVAFRRGQRGKRHLLGWLVFWPLMLLMALANRLRPSFEQFFERRRMARIVARIVFFPIWFPVYLIMYVMLGMTEDMANAPTNAEMARSIGLKPPTDR